MWYKSEHAWILKPLASRQVVGLLQIDPIITHHHATLIFWIVFALNIFRKVFSRLSKSPTLFPLTICLGKRTKPKQASVGCFTTSLGFVRWGFAYNTSCWRGRLVASLVLVGCRLGLWLSNPWIQTVAMWKRLIFVFGVIYFLLGYSSKEENRLTKSCGEINLRDMTNLLSWKTWWKLSRCFYDLFIQGKWLSYSVHVRSRVNLRLDDKLSWCVQRYCVYRD